MATDFHCERKAASTDAPRATPLLLVLREGLKLTGKRVAEMTNWGKKRERRYSGSQVAGIAEVSVDRNTGQIMVHDFWCAASTAASRFNRTTSWHKPRAALSTGWACR
jgi:hypothetical protein